MKTQLKPVYWENQKQCAAALGLDVRELREWKAENCPAFRFSRIYHADLLDWIAKKKKGAHRRRSTAKLEQNELPKSHWDREKARADFERTAFNLEVEKKKQVPLDEICAAVGQMLAGLMSGLRMLPASAARWLVGLREFHQIKAKLETELDTVLASLNRARYVEDIAPEVIDRVLADRTKEYRDDVKTTVAAVFVEWGRQCLGELKIDLGEQR